MNKLIEQIGVPALMEQCAEECSELTRACLKMSRKFRNDNPTPLGLGEITQNLEEEIADVQLCIDAVISTGLVSINKIEACKRFKEDRWERRLEKHELGEVND